MSPVTKSKAWQEVELARCRLIVSQPFFGTLALNLTMMEVAAEHGIETMATDGRFMYFNPEFVNRLNEEEIKGVTAHEVWHCALRHMTRRGHRDPTKWNLATDFRINYDCIEAGFKLPGKPGGIAEMQAIYAGKLKPGKNEIYYCYDKQFANMTAEEIYERIPDPPEMPGGSVIVVDLGGCGAVLDAGKGPGQADGNDDTVNPDVIAGEWDANVRMAVAIERARQAGNMPGYLERLIKDLKKPKINWRDQTRQFIDQSISKDFTYTRPSRRTMPGGMILPGMIPDALHELVVFIDISGSISHEMATAMLSEAAAALYDGITDKMFVVYTDTDVACVDEFLPGDIVTAKTRDGGGTHFAKAMEWLPKNAPDAACAIFLTDGETASWGEDPGIPVLWGVLTTEQRFAEMKPPFGSPIYIDSPQ
jgi:predicted metal-dependent peptidase